MTKMTKRFVAGMLSSAFVLSLGMTAFADDAVLDGTTWTNDVTVTVTTEVPTIKVTLPTTADITINPYKMEVDLTEGGTSSESIISPEYTIKNESDCGVKITATASATAAGEAVVATAALKGTETTKSVFLYIDAAYGDQEYGEAYNAKAVNQLAITTKDVSKTIMELDATDDEGTYMIKGNAASAPTNPWKDTDTVTVKLNFKVDPVATEEESGT